MASPIGLRQDPGTADPKRIARCSTWRCAFLSPTRGGGRPGSAANRCSEAFRFAPSPSCAPCFERTPSSTHVYTRKDRGGQDFCGGCLNRSSIPLPMLPYSLFIRYYPKSREPPSALINWRARFLSGCDFLDALSALAVVLCYRATDRRSANNPTRSTLRNSRACLLCADFQYLTTIRHSETEGYAVFFPTSASSGWTPLVRGSDGRFGLRRFRAKP
jgi:hypothetical protein